MDLNTLWFVLIAILYIGFFILEGFDYGVGILLPFLGKDDQQRRQIINTIGPFWDGNEVWLITAGGATFAAFPHWYATLFSGFYLALLLILLALILRGVAFEFRSKDENPLWRSLWDWAIFIGSAIPALLFGVAFGNLVRGVPIDANMQYVGTFFDLLNPYALVAGLASLITFTLHGAIFLSLRTDDEVLTAARSAARRLWLPTVIVLATLWVYTYFATDILERLGINPGVIPLIGMIAMLGTGYMLRRGWDGWAFVGTAISIAAAVITMFIILYPRVMISSLNPEWSLTIYNASSSPYTLRLMAIIAVIFVPIVLGYQAWTYWVFRHRVTREQRLEY
ncbi:MAG: cytochrome d ubiquinol oxidase subunit II [Anaerolineae bacterium]|nr:cytochrome d ubiquinol oxidase subunit II [Anaerolineae bacterium]MDW8100380.1 cytochrome d ubiquinol oxidase subunit II [Anaerolineae bacterium]